MKRIVVVVAGLLCFFMGAGLIMPALAKVHDQGSMPLEVVSLYTLGIVLTLAGFSAVALSFRKHKAT